jgi:Protein of unknown function (DUF3237)
MPDILFKDLPETLTEIKTRPLFVMRLVVPKVVAVGATPGAFRRVGVVSGGVFEGERLSGEVLDGGNDWQNVRTDGATTLDVRLVLKTRDDALVAMTYRGIRHGPADVIARIEKGEAVDPRSYYFRINPMFETSAPQYAWMNRILAVGAGHRFRGGPVYSVFEVL